MPMKNTISNFEPPTSSLSCNFKSPIQTRHRPVRIADVLLSNEGHNDEVLEEFLMVEGSRESRRSIDCCLSLRRILARWLSRLRRGGAGVKRVKERKRLDKEEEEREFDANPNPTVQARHSMDGLNGGDSVNSASHPEAGGQCRRETFVNLGVGSCLLYLIAASRKELDKMMEMRLQMETFLQELQNKDLLSKLLSSELNDIFANSSTAEGGPDFGSQLSPQILTTSCVLPDSSTITGDNQSLKCESPKQEECLDLEGMEKLEEELEAELELLQFHLDTEKLSKHPQQQRIWLNDEDTASKSLSVSAGEVTDPVIELQAADTQFHYGVSPYELERKLHELLEARQQEQIKELQAADTQFHYGVFPYELERKLHELLEARQQEQIKELQAADTQFHYGVSPYKLERKLHELLEARQQEQIKELEAALECANHKLRKKEIEVSWWKDTARLISQHVPESSHFTLQPGLKLITP